MDARTGYYEGFEGRLHYRWWSADNPPWVVLFAHGFGDHAGRYARFAERMVAHGGALYVPDRRGNGLSDGERVVVEDFDAVAREYLKVLEVPSFPTGVPVILAGQSMGGLVATRAAVLGATDVAGLAVSAARLGGWPAAEELLAAIDRGEIDPERGGGNHPLLDRKVKLPTSALCRDESIFEEFVNDPLTYLGPYPVETLRAYVAATRDLRQRVGVLTFPVLYLHGGADEITPYRESARRMVQLTAGDLEVRIFPGARHSIYNELNKDEVFDVLIRFITRAVSARMVHDEPVATG